MCECLSRIQDILKERNTEMNVAFFFDGKAARPTIEVNKIDKKIKGKAMNILMSHCPFCGIPYEPDPAEELADGLADAASL